MDPVASCQEKLAEFRLKELKYVLSRAGITKQGKKQDLVDRIVALLYDEGTPGVLKKLQNGREGLVEIIDDVYRNMQESGTKDSPLKKQSCPGTSGIEVKEETLELIHPRKLRCPCGSTFPTDPSIQCEDPDCGVWQHIPCVFIPDNPVENLPAAKRFFCEICRLKRADPFWQTVGHPVNPVKLAVVNVNDDGGDPLQTMEKTFQLTKADSQLLKNPEYEVQAWCMLLNDSVLFRMQWPKYADLQINGIPVRTVNRPGSQLLGANGRDDGAKISMFISEGVNKISLSGCDPRIFCFGIRLVKRRTFEQVLSMIPKEADGESLEIAIARVQRCIGGGITTEKEESDNDDDVEVIADAITVNLCCPMSGSRMKIAGRFRSCAHMGCFDLETFVKLNERSRKWQCPICIKNYSVEDLIVDPYFNRVVTMMQNVGEEITEIDVKPDGCWRARKAIEFKDLVAWHHPDGTEVVSPSIGEQEDKSREFSLNLGIKNHSGEPHDLHVNPKVITMSSSDSGDDQETETVSINQNCDQQIGILGSNGNEVDSGLYDCGLTHRTADQSSAVPDVIVLSDSEEDEVSLVYPESTSAAVSYSDEKLPPAHLIPDLSSALETVAVPSISNRNGDGYTMPELLYPSSLHSGSFGQSSDVDADDSGAVVDLEQTSTTCSPSDSSSIFLKYSANPGGYALNSSVLGHNGPSDNGLVDNHLGSVEENPSMPWISVAFSSLTKQLPVQSNENVEDCVSARLEAQRTAGCSGVIEAHDEFAGASGTYLEDNSRSSKDFLPSNHVSELGSSPSSERKRVAGPFTFPQRPRSVRRRQNL